MIRQFLPEPRDLTSAADIESAYDHPGGGHVRVNFVASIDGAVEIGGRSGPLGGPADRAVFVAMRAVSDVILVGAGTARTENYGPVRLSDGARSRRAERGQSDLPLLALVSGRADLAVDARLFGPGSRVVLYTTAESAARRADLAEVAEVVSAGDDRVDVEAVLADLAERNLERILCEGGPQLTRSLMDVSRLDELCLTIAPILAGDLRTTLAGSGRFTLAGLAVAEDMIFTRYRPEIDR